MKTTGKSFGLYLSLSSARSLAEEACLLRRKGRLGGGRAVSVLASAAAGLPPVSDLDEVLCRAFSLFSVLPAAERTFELPLGGWRADTFPLLRRHSFRRILLTTGGAEGEGAPSSAPSGWEEAVRRARAEGITRFGVDIRGFEETPEERLVALLHSIAPLRPETISLYEGGEREVADELWIARYRAAAGLLFRAGYERNEICHFALPGTASVHQKLVYGGGDVVGLGPGAVSHVGARRWRNRPDPARYEEDLRLGRLPLAEEALLSREELFQERLFLGLRRSAGVDPWLEARALGLCLSSATEKAVDALRRRGWLEPGERRVVLTEEGIPLAEALAREIGSEAERERTSGEP